MPITPLYTAFDLDTRSCQIRTADDKVLAKVVNRTDLTDDELVALCHQMKAAPELLEACKKALEALNNPDDDAIKVEELEAALELAIENATSILA